MPRRPSLALLLLLALAACSPHAPVARPSPEAPMTRSTDDACTADWLHAGTWYGKPTLTRLSFDVTMRNPSTATRWVIVPRRADEPSGASTRGVTVYALPGGAFLWRFEGLGGFWAVRLPAGAEVRLRSLELDAWWERPPEVARLAVLSAEDVLVDGTPAATWVGFDGVSPARGEFAAKIDAMKSPVAKFRQTEADPSGLSPEVKVALVGARPSPADAPLNPKR